MTILYCEGVTTTDDSLSGLAVRGGVTPTAAALWLVRSQLAPTTNGVYEVSSGAWTRSQDADSEAELTCLEVHVCKGDTHRGSIWRLSTRPPITVGVTELQFIRMDARLDVRLFRAQGDENDQPAIHRAIETAKLSGGGIVWLPGGVYEITSTIKIDGDGIILEGDGRSTVIRCNSAPSSVFIPILLQKGPNSGPEILKHVGVRDLTVEFIQCGPSSGGAIQFNGCSSWFCEGVTVKGDGVGMSGSTTNGIAAAWQSSDGVISDCVVDGVSKPGFYMAWAERVTVTGCIARGIYSTVDPEYGVGFSAAQSSDVVFLGCHAHKCTGSGFTVTAVGKINPGAAHDGEISAFTDSTHFKVTMTSAYAQSLVSALAVYNTTACRYEALRVSSIALDSGNTWTVALDAAPSQALALGTKVIGNYRPHRRVQILGGTSTHNGLNGVRIGSLISGAVGQDLVISGLLCANNGGQGIGAAAVDDLVITGCILQDNQTGIALEDSFTADTKNLMNRVLVQGCRVHNNTNVGIFLKAVNDLTIDQVTISRISRQPTGVRFVYQSHLSTRKKATNVRLRVEFVGYSNGPSDPIFSYLDDEWSAPESGRYALQFAGDPEGGIFAPAGSEYVNLTTGKTFQKRTGHDKNGWALSYTEADAAVAATGRTLGLRNSHGDLNANDFNTASGKFQSFGTAYLAGASGGVIEVNGGPVVQCGSASIGFYGSAPISRPTVSGSRGSNAALESLLTALVNLGLIKDSSS